jgi:hypothetical protein
MIDQGMVTFITWYYRGFSASQSRKCVHRFMPQEVGELIVYYLWLIEPFVRILQSSHGRLTFSSWLWEPAPEEEWGEDEEEWGEDEEEWAEGDGLEGESDLLEIPEDQSAEARFVQEKSTPMAPHDYDRF